MMVNGDQFQAETADQLDLFFTFDLEAGKQERVFAPPQWQGYIVADLQSIYGNLDTGHYLGSRRHTEPYASQRRG